MSIELSIPIPLMQLSYGSTTDITLRSVLSVVSFPKMEFAYTSFSRDVKIGNIPYPGDVPHARITYNVLYFMFKGKSYLFDPAKNTIKEVGAPAVVVFPNTVSREDRAYVTGGLAEDGTIRSEFFVSGLEVYTMTADREYIGVVIPTGTVYIIDDVGSVVSTFNKINVITLLRNWKLVSRSPFTAILQRML